MATIATMPDQLPERIMMITRGWIYNTHKQGDIVRVKTCDITTPRQIRNFRINRDNVYIAEVFITGDNNPVVNEHTNISIGRVYGTLSKFINASTTFAAEIIAINPDALRFVKAQTPELCLAAVNQNGCALEYVNEQTPELCLMAVSQNGRALQYVKQ